MPLKRYKNDDGKILSVGQVLYAKRYNLTLDRGLCRGCDVCRVVCPREAISLKPLNKAVDGKARAPLVDIDAEKCDYHAICATMCPFGAIKVSLNEQSHFPVVEKDAYPELVRRIEVVSDGCDPGCRVCEEKCPLKVISVCFKPITSKEAARKGIRVATGAEPMQTVVNIDKPHCATCKVCEASCPAQVIKVEKFFNGNISIDQSMCPEGCHNCLDVCPVEALYLEDGKVYPNNEFCIYCRACVNVCPKPEALDVVRTSIRHSDVKSGAWNKSLEKLASVEGMRREFTAKRMTKAKDAIVKLERLGEKS
ncbi:4Fe-4S dicluster domain-containing protein [Candidatus Bathyarchaeota archaeon]|nr:4Fe-4S dicluster domain-containing protein [Candidatus Bathyarchaeota archaeon]